MGLSKFESLFVAGRWVVPAALMILAIAMAIGGDEARTALRFDRIWITEGETWRFVTGHLAHLNWSHLLLNCAGLLLVWFLVGDRFNLTEWWIVIATCVLIMNAGLWFFSPTLIWYVGLSGLLHGLLAAGLVVNLRLPDGETLLIATLVIGKLIWEQNSGPLPGSEATAGGSVVVDAHLYGTLGGILGAMFTGIRVKRRASI